MPTTKTSLALLIKGHKFDYVNSDITVENFPSQEVSTDFELYHFDRYISSEAAIEEMKKDGYKPANIYELLLWPDWNGKDWVVALGSVCGVGGDRLVACLDGVDSERYLDLGWFGGVCDGGCRFLATKQLSLDTAMLGASPSETLPLELIINGIKYIKA